MASRIQLRKGTFLVSETAKQQTNDRWDSQNMSIRDDAGRRQYDCFLLLEQFREGKKRNILLARGIAQPAMKKKYKTKTNSQYVPLSLLCNCFVEVTAAGQIETQ